MIGLTGASGRLGQAILRIRPDLIPIGRWVPTDRLDAVIHAATARGRTQEDADDFHRFNTEVAAYAARHDCTVVNIGSCWQILNGTCREQPYTRMKDTQEALLPEAVHLIPYWIYGPQRGYIHDLVAHLRGGPLLAHAGTEPRDFIHVSDVARAALLALHMPPGRYAAASLQPVNPHRLAHSHGLHLPIREDPVTATLDYPLATLGRSRISLHEYVNGERRDADPIATERNRCRIHSQATTRTADPNPTEDRAG